MFGIKQQIQGRLKTAGKIFSAVLLWACLYSAIAVAATTAPASTPAASPAAPPAAPSVPDSYEQGSIHISHVWANISRPEDKDGSVYADIINTGDEKDKLIKASTPIAGRVDIEKIDKVIGFQKGQELKSMMKKIDSVDVDPDVPLTLRPGSIRLEMIGIKHLLKKGDVFPVTLQFEKAGTIKVNARAEDHSVPPPRH